jgi:diacylglycerol kinase family enzyme
LVHQPLDRVSATFAYVYDERLAERKFQRDIARLEADLAGFGIGGRIARLSLFRKAKDTIEDFQRDGIRHLVVVGDDETLLRMMWFLPDLNMSIGFVPLIGSSIIAPFLGIKNVKSAVHALTGRLTASFDVGKVGDRHFFTKVVIPDTRAELEIDGKFKLRPTEGGTITITNLGEGSASDGVLNVSVSVGAAVKRFPWSKPEQNIQTYLPLTNGQVHSEEPVTLEVDGQALQGTSFKISVIPNKVRFLVGKGRKVG